MSVCILGVNSFGQSSAPHQLWSEKLSGARFTQQLQPVELGMQPQDVVCAFICAIQLQYHSTEVLFKLSFIRPLNSPLLNVFPTLWRLL